eukprot:4694784-Pyramimonas_sp.AAC.1
MSACTGDHARARTSSYLLQGALATTCAQGRPNDFDTRTRETRVASLNENLEEPMVFLRTCNTWAPDCLDIPAATMR